MKELRAWQQEALQKWGQLGHRAVVEAVTGSGKTEVGIAAVVEAVEHHRQVLVVVPSRDLLRQWYERLRRSGFSGTVGRRGDGSRDSFRKFDVLISTVQSSVAADAELPLPGALLVADEVHRYGAESFSRVLSEVFEQRLGLTATFERSDDGIDRVLTPFFENTIVGCTYRRGYDDGILAPVNVALVPVPFTPIERARYDHFDEVASFERYALISKYGCQAKPFGAYLQDVQALANGEFAGDPSTRSARRYMKAFADRRELLASVKGKEAALAQIAHGLERSERTLVFAETKGAAASASETLLGQGVAAAPYTSDLSRANRIALLETFKDGGITTLAAPRVLDEGIDVPEADVGIVLAASRTRRQMIQRMGRVIRPKSDGRPAVFIVMFAEGSAEDPDEGAHATFLEQLTEIAQKQIRVEPGDVGKLLEVWLPETNSETPAAARADARALASSTTVNVTEQAEVLHRRAAQIRRGVVDATRFSRPEVLDILLAALLEVEPIEAQILIHRFGLDGDDPRDIPAIAKLTGMDADEVLGYHDAALLKVSLPDGESEFRVSDPAVQRPPYEVGPSVQHSVGDRSIARPVDVLNGVRGARSVRPIGVGNRNSSQRSSPVIDPKPAVSNQPFGLRHIQLPGKDGGPVEKDAPRGVAKTVRIYMECVGHFPAATLDTRSGEVTLDDAVQGRRQFDDPDAAAQALVQFYDAPGSGKDDGWSMWRIKHSGQPIATLERESSKERHTKEGLHRD